MDRRLFLQRMGIAAAVVSWDQIVGWGEFYQKAIAATPRKTAVLMGINRYPELGDATSLQGALTDLDLQRELLIYRFGFLETDIFTFTDEKVSSGQLESLRATLDPTLETLLVHFSGYGTWITGAAGIEPALVLSGGTPWGLNRLLGQVNQINLDPVSLDQGDQEDRIRAPSLQVATILDCGFSYFPPSLRGNLRLRSYPTPDPIKVGTFWSNPPKGLLITATTPHALAAEASWSGFTAGLLTYLLTQYLWEVIPPRQIYTAFLQATSPREFGALADQRPMLHCTLSCLKEEQSPLDLESDLGSGGCTGVIQEVHGNRATVWLGGIPAGALCGLQNGTLLMPVSGSGSDLVLRSRRGLWAEVQTFNGETISSPPGTLVKERVRLLSSSLRLVLGIDDTFDRVTRVDITSALSPYYHWVDMISPRDRQVDCLLGRMTPELLQPIAESTPPHLLPPTYSYGLFWRGLEWIPYSFGSSGESAGGAIQRLIPRLQHLLAAKRLRTLLNRGVSDLQVQAEWLQEDPTSGCETHLELDMNTIGGPPQFPTRYPVQLRLTNLNTQDLYAYLLLVDSLGQVNVLSPVLRGGVIDPLVLQANQLLVLPCNELRLLPDSFTDKPQGLSELIIVVSSRSPQAILDLIRQEWGIHQGNRLLSHPVEWIQSFLNQLTSGAWDPDLRQLIHKETLTLSLPYRII
jgi:hypothetical protein